MCRGPDLELSLTAARSERIHLDGLAGLRVLVEEKYIPALLRVEIQPK